MDFKKWVKSIQTAGYNGARTVHTYFYFRHMHKIKGSQQKVKFDFEHKFGPTWLDKIKTKKVHFPSVRNCLDFQIYNCQDLVLLSNCNLSENYFHLKVVDQKNSFQCRHFFSNSEILKPKNSKKCKLSHSWNSESKSPIYSTVPHLSSLLLSKIFGATTPPL